MEGSMPVHDLAGHFCHSATAKRPWIEAGSLPAPHFECHCFCGNCSFAHITKCWHYVLPNLEPGILCPCSHRSWDWGQKILSLRGKGTLFCSTAKAQNTANQKSRKQRARCLLCVNSLIQSLSSEWPALISCRGSRYSPKIQPPHLYMSKSALQRKTERVRERGRERGKRSLYNCLPSRQVIIK